jgi:hypothetical protein
VQAALRPHVVGVPAGAGDEPAVLDAPHLTTESGANRHAGSLVR